MGYLNNFISSLCFSIGNTKGYDFIYLKELIESDKSSKIVQKLIGILRWKDNIDTSDEKTIEYILTILTLRYLNLYHNILSSSKKSEFLLKEFKCLLSTEKNNFQEIYNFISGEYVHKSKICDSIIGEFLNIKLIDLLSVIKSRLMTHEVNWGILILFIQKIDQNEHFMNLISEMVRNSIQNEIKNDLIVILNF
jgi:hypothetical protein